MCIYTLLNYILHFVSVMHFSSSVQQEPTERAKFRIQSQIMGSKLRIILISARTNLEYLKTVFQIAAWGFFSKSHDSHKNRVKRLSKQKLALCAAMLQEIKYMFLYDNTYSLENNCHKIYPNLEKFKLPWNKSKSGKQRMPMDLSFCTTSVKNNQTVTLFFLVRAKTRLD